MAVAAGEEGESDRRHRAHAPALVEARKEVPRLLQRGKYEARQIAAHPVQGTLEILFWKSSHLRLHVLQSDSKRVQLRGRHDDRVEHVDDATLVDDVVKIHEEL